MIQEPKIEDYKTLIEQALEHSGGTHGFEDIVEGVDRGRYQFWPGIRSVIITELLAFPRQYDWIAGERDHVGFVA